MFNYELYIDETLVRSGDESEFNRIADQNLFGQNTGHVETEAHMKASVEGYAIGYFMREFVKDPVFDDLEQLSKMDFVISSGLVISSYLDFMPRVRIEITETLN